MHSPTPVCSTTLTVLVAFLAAGAVFSDRALSQELSWASEAFGDGFEEFDLRRRGSVPVDKQYAFGPQAFPALLEGGARPVVQPLQPERMTFRHNEPPGTILIDSGARRLYFALTGDEAYVYPVSVGREGFSWTGTEKISRVAEWPDWYPPKEMRERDPRLPEKMLGGIRNPLGATALYLGDTLYRIHGTNDPKTIGLAASSGCFRMLNGHIVHLASLVEIGATVKVLSDLDERPASVAKVPERNPIRELFRDT